MNELAIVIKTMDHIEARSIVRKINDAMNNVRALVLDLYERDGWSALGYTSWRECVTAEFKDKQRYLYYQLEAAQAEKNICTNVQKEQIPESQLRPLTKLKDEPEKQREAWKKAVETAPEGKVTAAHVAKVVKEITGEQTKHESPKPQPTIPERAIYFAQIAISQLERIADDDPTRWSALEKVENWINKYRITHTEEKPIKKHNESIIKSELISEDFQSAFDAMVIELKNARALKWKATSYQGALESIRTLVAIIENMGRSEVIK